MAPTLKNMPLVSVIMPVYNAEQFLREALESILHQTYSNLEIIIVDDGSTDGSRDIILSYRDPRIAFVDNAVNGGLVSVMNAGLSRVHGTYIIRADADDISLPTRIAEQVQFMEQHQDIGILGTWMQTIGASRGYTMKCFTKHEDICANLLFNTSLAQPSACICASMFKKSNLAYDPTFKDGAEDYDLWVRASKVTRLACLPRVLVQYRVHAGSVSTTRATANQANTRSIRRRQLAELDLTPTDEELSLHSRLTCSPQWKHFTLSREPRTMVGKNRCRKCRASPLYRRIAAESNPPPMVLALRRQCSTRQRHSSLRSQVSFCFYSSRCGYNPLREIRTENISPQITKDFL